MTVVKKNGFMLATSGTATQVVLYCHGGWVEKDGMTTIPKEMRLCFYAGHGHFTLGNTVYSAVMNAGKLARGGMMKQLPISEEDLPAYASLNRQTVDEARQSMLKKAVGVYDSFEGGNPMYNYSLSRGLEKGRLNFEKGIFKTHSQGQLCHDIDLIMMEKSCNRHLSDVFRLIEGRGYTTLHFGACRSGG